MNAIPKLVSMAVELAATVEIDDLPLPYIEIDARGFIVRANRACLALHDPRQGELVGRSSWDLMAADEKDVSSAAFLSVMASGRHGDRAFPLRPLGCLPHLPNPSHSSSRPRGKTRRCA